MTDDPSDLTATTPDFGSTPSEDVPVIEGYEILSRLGQGGMGVVYLARQVRADRLVALKMIDPGRRPTEQQSARFRTEALAVARLHHPNIVPLYEVGEQQGLPFFSLEYCPDGSLDGKLGEPIAPADAARLVESLARGAAYAHAQGIVHRDLKPSNVLLGESGEPKLTDFGLARCLDVDSRQTQSGAILGTPSYMAPEQARGEADIGPAADTHALGAILYECLTGRVPFKGATAHETIQHVLTREPLRPRLIRPGVPCDLETICLKCLEKEPYRRYERAGELAADLARFLDGQPVVARPRGPIERAARSARRNPAVAGLLFAVAALLAAGTAVSLHYAVRARAEADAANDAKLRADEEARTARRLVHDVRMNLVQRAVENGELATAQNLLDAQRPIADGEDLRGFEWHYLLRQCPSRGQVIPRLPSAVTGVAYNRDGSVIAAACGSPVERRQPGEVVLVDAATGRAFHRLRGHGGFVRLVAFWPRGDVVASAGDDGSVRLWDQGGGVELRQFTAHAPKPITGLAFARDGAWLASAGGDGFVRVYDPEAREERRSWKAASPPVALAAGAGPALVGLLADASLVVWDTRSGEVTGTIRAAAVGPRALAVSPDGVLAACACHDQTVRVWDLTGKAERHTLRAHQDAIAAVCFSPDGGWLASTAADQTTRVWDMATGKEVFAVKSHQSRYNWCVAFSPDGRRIATGNYDQSVRVWEVRPAPAPVTFRGHGTEVRGVAAHPDGKQAVSAGFDHLGRVWDVTTGREERKFVGHAFRPFAVAVGPEGNVVATAALDGTVRVWDFASGRCQHTLTGHGRSVYGVAVAPGEKVIASAGIDKTIRLWDAGSGEELRVLRGHGREVYGLAFHPGGKVLASSSFDATVRLWDVRTGEERLKLEGHGGPVPGVCFSADGKVIASASWDNTVKLWDAETGAELRTLAGHTAWVYAVAFTPDGKRVVSGSTDATVRVWDARTGVEVLVLRGHEYGVTGVAVSPDGSKILSSGIDGLVRVWDGTPAEE